MKPNKTRIKKLIAALRSGKYKQGTGGLRSGNKFCCLGVACEVYRQAEGGDWVDNCFLDCFAMLPTEVSEWFGFDVNNPTLGNTDAVELNDGDKLSFKRIATRFEKAFLKP